MSSKKAAFLNIANALIFAGTILLSGFLLQGSEHKQTIMYLLIALWFIPFSYLSTIEHKNKKTSDC